MITRRQIPDARDAVGPAAARRHVAGLPRRQRREARRAARRHRLQGDDHRRDRTGHRPRPGLPRAPTARGGRSARGGYRGNVAITSLAGAGVHGRRPPARPRPLRPVVTDAPAVRPEPGEPPTAAPRLPAQPPGHARTARCTATASPRCSWPRSTAWSTTAAPRATSATSSRRAVELILNAQNREGGWRYQPVQHRRRPVGDHLPDHGPALRPQRRHRGAEVDGRQVHRVRQALPGPRGRRFRYMTGGGGGGATPSPAPAAGVVGPRTAPASTRARRSRRGCDYLMTYKPGRGAGSWPCGPTCTTSTATTTPPRRCGPPAASYWPEWFPAIRDELLGAAARPTAPGTTPICPHYGTAMACIILQIPNNYLPILQK